MAQEDADDALALEFRHLVLDFWRPPDHEGLHPRCVGSVEIERDSDDSVWVTPCRRLEMNEKVIRLIADHLRPMGIVYMRGWGYGGRQGRVITANGPMVEEPHRPLDIENEAV